MNFTTSDGVSIFLEREGNGVPCLFLHGGPGYWSKSFKEYTHDLLYTDIDVIYFDQRGCGRSDLASNGDYSLDRLIQDMEEIRVQCEIEQWYLMGHSFGGILAVNYALRYPNNVKGLILSNATLNMVDSFNHQIKKGRELLHFDPVTEDLIMDPTTLIQTFFTTAQQLIEHDLFDKLQFRNSIDKEKLDKVDSDLVVNPEFQQYIFASDEFFHDFSKQTSDINTPVLVLTGKYDYAIGPRHQESFHFKHATYRELDSGHHPYVDNPIAFKQAILDFLSSTSH